MTTPLHRALARLKRRWAENDGYTLIELLTAMTILGIVLAAVITVFTAGIRAQAYASERVAAQQEARIAVDRLRHEAHCASDASPDGGSLGASVTLTLPADCPAPETSVTWTTVSIGGGEWELRREGLTVARDIVEGGQTFLYTAPTGESYGLLEVDLKVNPRVGQSHTEWHLQDEIVLRNARPTS